MAAMAQATITSKGQVTIPADIRKSMGLTEGERVVFTVLDDGTTVMRAKSRSIVGLKGMLKSPRRRKGRISIAEMSIGRS
jgi:AbrB family looped-hinge helix DNA binding protein